MNSSPYVAKASSPARTVASAVVKCAVGSHLPASPVAADAPAAAAAAAREDRQKAVANARLRSFRRIVHERVSARRFRPDAPVPEYVWEDILRMTRVSAGVGFVFWGGEKCLIPRRANLGSALSPA